ncbi:MAG: sugar ABC transporter permease [Christensenellaceae bacterium]|nr:sugar ABC transporter permease [Christensenellaceae bacterium]
MAQSLAPAGRVRHAHLSPYARKKWRTSVLAWGLLLPSFLFLGTITLYPIVSSAVASFYRDNLSTIKPVYVGLKQYAQLSGDPIFMKSFYNNLLVAAVTIPASIGLAVAMAIFAHKVRFGKGFVRVAFFYPTLLPMVAVANIWLFIYTPGYGLLGYINPSWRLLSNPDSAIWALIAMLIWKQAGYVMIFYISGLQNINEELYDAAEIDGARPLGIFRHITWPLLRPTTLYVSIIALTNAYKLVDHLYIMTKGGPNNSTNMLLFYIFQVGFDFWDVGRASAMTVVLVGLLLLVSAVQFFTQDKRTFYS